MSNNPSAFVAISPVARDQKAYDAAMKSNNTKDASSVRKAWYSALNWERNCADSPSFKRIQELEEQIKHLQSILND